MDTSKFKSNPFNSSNIKIKESDILNILKNHNIQNYKINDLSLFQTSFIHTSYCQMKDYEEYENTNNSLNLFNESYETLEFLGDSLLGCCVTKYLFNRYVKLHKQNEGFLTKLKIRLICGEQLCYLSEQIGFDKYMVISKHIEDNCSGRRNIHILEDIYEAFLGALYLDSRDITIIDKFIINCIEQHIDISDLILNDNNYKGQLLKYFQHNFKIHPKYETTKDESNNFICKIYKDDDISHVCTGYGPTKKKSEQDASKNALIAYRVMSE